MKKKDIKLADAKIKELFDSIKSTTYDKRIEISWDELSKIRLESMKEETWENIVRIALLNFLMKTCSDITPAFPQAVIDFLRSAKP
jgi:hypothetical protein